MEKKEKENSQRIGRERKDKEKRKGRVRMS